MNNKLEEFEHQLAEVENKILELEELREDLYHRIDEETEKESQSKTLTLNGDQLHKLLCYLDSTIIDEDAIKEQRYQNKLIDFIDDLSWTIADLFGYDMNEGSINPNTYEFYTYSSKREK